MIKWTPEVEREEPCALEVLLVQEKAEHLVQFFSPPLRISLITLFSPSSVSSVLWSCEEALSPPVYVSE